MLTGGMEAAVGKSIGLVVTGPNIIAAAGGMAAPGGASSGADTATDEDLCPGQVPA